MKKFLFEGEDFNSFLQSILDSGDVSDMERYLFQKVRRDGFERLRIHQRILFRGLFNKWLIASCRVCNRRIEWSEMKSAVLHDGKCHSCFVGGK